MSAEQQERERWATLCIEAGSGADLNHRTFLHTGDYDLARHWAERAADWRKIAALLRRTPEAQQEQRTACPACSEDGTVLKRCRGCGEEFYDYALSMARSRRFARRNPEADARHRERTGRGMGEIPAQQEQSERERLRDYLAFVEGYRAGFKNDGGSDTRAAWLASEARKRLHTSPSTGDE